MPPSHAFCEQLRRNTATGRPTATAEFVRRIEAQLERDLAPRKRGRPAKVQSIDLTEDHHADETFTG
ncbi:MAG: hypothetical protein ACR2IE_09145 [Candidatus Sumerlaeaceae bacterium]